MTAKGRAAVCEELVTQFGHMLEEAIDVFALDGHCISFALIVGPAGEKSRLASTMCRRCLEENLSSLLEDLHSGALQVPEDDEPVGHA